MKEGKKRKRAKPRSDSADGIVIVSVKSVVRCSDTTQVNVLWLDKASGQATGVSA